MDITAKQVLELAAKYIGINNIKCRERSAT